VKRLATTSFFNTKKEVGIMELLFKWNWLIIIINLIVLIIRTEDIKKKLTKEELKELNKRPTNWAIIRFAIDTCVPVMNLLMLFKYLTKSDKKILEDVRANMKKNKK